MRRHEVEAAQEARKLANLISDLMLLTSSPAGPDGYEGDFRRSLARSVRQMLGYQPPRWQVVCSPVSAWKLAKERRKSIGDAVGPEDWARISRLLSQLRFGYVLEPNLAVHLARVIESGALTARDVWRLTHSLGCRVAGESLQPAPVSRFVSLAGLVASSIVAVAGIWFIFGAATSALGPCLNICELMGNLAMACFSAHLAPLLLMSTWGRRNASIALQQVLEAPLGAKFERRPLVARLAW